MILIKHMFLFTVDINFPPALYKKLLNKPVSLKDLEKMWPTRVASLRQLLAYNEPDFEDVMCLTFAVTRLVTCSLDNTLSPCSK